MTLFVGFQRNGQSVVKGESKALGHEGWIEATSFHSGDSLSPGDFSAGVHRASGSSLLTIVKPVDSASPRMQSELQNPTPLSINVDFVKNADGKDQTYLSFTVNEAVIAADHYSSLSGSRGPVESLDFFYANITIDPHGAGADVSDQVCYLYKQVCYLDE